MQINTTLLVQPGMLTLVGGSASDATTVLVIMVEK